MIVSASRRTDLPAFHADWLAEKIALGSVEVANPFNPSQKRVVDLTPSPHGGMDALVVWTRNPAPLLPHLPEWEKRGVRSLYLVTLTGYPRALEPATPTPEEALAALRKLAGLVGRERIIWRHDPIFASGALKMNASWHAENFARLAEKVKELTRGVVLSVYDDYAAARGRLKRAGIDFDGAEALNAAGAVAKISRELALPAQACCEELSAFGVQRKGCIDWGVLGELWGIQGEGRDGYQRKECLCAPSADIGSYSTCGHGCLYCYATRRGPAPAVLKTPLGVYSRDKGEEKP